MRTFKTALGTELPLLDIKGKPYLTVQHRILWFREEKPLWTIETKIVEHTKDHAIFEALIKDETGRLLCNAHKYEDRQGFPDFLEKAASGAIGRALGFLGYGTAFALDLEEGQRLADAPTEEKKRSEPQRQASNDEPPWPDEQPTQHMAFVEPHADMHPKNFTVDFGKYKGKTIGDIIAIDGAAKLQNYAIWLESDSRNKNKDLSKSASAFLEMAKAAIQMEIEHPAPKENLNSKLSRLKNQFEPGIDQSEEIPF